MSVTEEIGFPEEGIRLEDLDPYFRSVFAKLQEFEYNLRWRFRWGKRIYRTRFRRIITLDPAMSREDSLYWASQMWVYYALRARRVMFGWPRWLEPTCRTMFTIAIIADMCDEERSAAHLNALLPDETSRLEWSLADTSKSVGSAARTGALVATEMLQQMEVHDLLRRENWTVVEKRFIRLHEQSEEQRAAAVYNVVDKLLAAVNSAPKSED
jgi:hypothetical protein